MACETTASERGGPVTMSHLTKEPEPLQAPQVYQQASPSQQSLVLECSVCAEQYGLKFDDQPRSLRCGHTFCTGCSMRIMTTRGVSCPMCNRFHQLPTPDVMLLPLNYAVLEIVKNIAAQDVPPNVPQRPLCSVCEANPATVICVHCSPGTLFKFCEKCDRDEHMRNFGPAQRHNRFPIDNSPVPSTSTFCSSHAHIAATLYSESLVEFACNLCQQEDDWQARAVHFELIHEVTEKMKERVKKLTKYSSDMLWKLGESKQNLETVTNDLEPGAMAVKTQVTETFSKCVELLQERQKTLLANVDVELKNRKESLKKQHGAVCSTITKYRNAYQDLNSLISKVDANFISVYHMSIRNIESSLDLEDKSILRPLVNREIPFCMSNIERQLSSLGAVGGGLTPNDLESVPKGPKGTLMQLFWQVPEGCGKLHRFQIEYEQVVDSSIERRGSESKEKENEPQYHEVPGNALSAYVDYLCLGYAYRFRIRSANDAGFGMWSDPIIAQSVGFPFTLEYTKKIHRIIIPAFGSFRITVKGAKGADGLMHKGGKGATISAVVSLKAGDVLILLCGGMSSRHHYHSGGGGGSFVALNEILQESLLIAAGGGGGTRGADAHDFSGSDANLYEDGSDGLGNYFGTGGRSGGPGGDADDGSNSEEPWSWGGGGAGFMQDSTTAQGFVAGGHAGQNGGFGGGGSVGMYGGGGGGGYSGGGGGRGGGGGGSYVISTAVDVLRSVGNEDHGSIFIEKVVPPYPTSFTRGTSTGGSSTSSPTSSTRGTSTGGSSTGSSNSVAQLEHQLSSSSFNTTRATTNSSSGSNSQIGVIPEDPPSLHQSPSSTGQVDENPVHFTIEGLDSVSEKFSRAPTLALSTQPLGNGQARTSYPEQYPPPSMQAPIAGVSMKPAQSAQNMGDKSVPQQWAMQQHSEPDLITLGKQDEEVPQRRHNNPSPPITQRVNPASSFGPVQQQQPQQQQQLLLGNLQPPQFQQQQQHQLASQPVNQLPPTTSPPMTAVQTVPAVLATVRHTQPPAYQQ